MALLIGSNLQRYINARTERTNVRNVRRVTSPLHVFKKVYNEWLDDAIANLIIMEGESIWIHPYAFAGSGWAGSWNERKMRATSAYVHSIHSVDPGNRSVRQAKSWFDPTFVYKVGEVVRPKFDFSFEQNTCASGIHFFVELNDALDF